MSKGKNYGKWLGDNKPPTARETLQDLIDANLIVGQSFPDFLIKLKRAGCEIKFGKHTAVKIPGGKKNIRFDSLPNDYNEAAIRERLRGVRDVVPRVKVKTAAVVVAPVAEPPKSVAAPKLLIDIEAKIRQGYGAGFEHYAKVQNLKEAAKTLIFLQENGVKTYDELVEKDSDVSEDYHSRNDRRKKIDARLAEITELQKQIGHYSKGRKIYLQYKALKWDQSFFEDNRAPITLYKAAKNYFDEHNYKGVLPSINELKQEYAKLLVERKRIGNIKAAREKMISWAMAKHNVDMILGDSPAPTKSRDRGAR